MLSRCCLADSMSRIKLHVEEKVHLFEVLLHYVADVILIIIILSEDWWNIQSEENKYFKMRFLQV